MQSDQYIDDEGYYRYKDSDRLVHRYIASRYVVKRPLSDDEVVVHKNGNKLDNQSSNLEVMTREEYEELDGPGGVTSTVLVGVHKLEPLPEKEEKTRMQLPSRGGCPFCSGVLVREGSNLICRNCGKSRSLLSDDEQGRKTRHDILKGGRH